MQMLRPNIKLGVKEFLKVLPLTPVGPPAIYYLDPPRKWRQWTGWILLSICSERCLVTNFKVVVKTDEKRLEAALRKQLPEACRESSQPAGPFDMPTILLRVPRVGEPPAASHSFSPPPFQSYPALSWSPNVDSVCLTQTPPCGTLSSCLSLPPTLLQAQSVFLEASLTLEGEFKSLNYLLQGCKHLHFITKGIPDLQEFFCDCNLSPLPPSSQRAFATGNWPQARGCLLPPREWVTPTADSRVLWPCWHPASAHPPHSSSRHRDNDIYESELQHEGDTLEALALFLNPARNPGTRRNKHQWSEHG